MQTFTSITLALVGLMFLGFGLVLISYPKIIENAEILVSHPTGLMEVRAFYGGLEIGLGLFILSALKFPQNTTPALYLICLIVGFVLLGRVIGAVADGIEGSYLWYAFAIEVPLFLCALIALSKKA